VFERLGSWAYRFRLLVVLAWLGLAVLMSFAPSLAGSGSSDQTTFLPASAPSVAARAAIERAFPGSTSSSSATITLYRPGGLTDVDERFRDDFAAWVSSDEAPAGLRAAVTGTETADSRPELGTLLRNADGSFEMLVINLNVADAGDSAAAVVRQLRHQLAATTPAGLETHATGAAAISSDYLDAVKAGTASTTLITIVLVIIVLLLIYRAPLAALVPLFTIGGAYLVSRGILGWLAAAGWQVSSTLDTFLVVLVFGVGTDYAIFLISRYREEVSSGSDWHAAARETVKRIGAVITASAGTVIVGMLAMGFANYRMLTFLGPSLGLAVAVTLIAGITLTPALLSIFGHYLFWPLHTRAEREGEAHGFFASLASVVSKHPGLVSVGLLAILLVPAMYMPQAKSNFDVLADLPATADSRLGYEQISSQLGEDKLVQSTALIATQGGDILSPANLTKLHDLIVQLHQESGVATTTSLITPDGDTTVPDAFRPSTTLADMASKMHDQGTAGGDSSAILGSDVRDGLSEALDYVNGLAVAFPDVGARSEMRAAQGGLQDALDVVDTVQKQSVLSTQLRTLAQSMTSPTTARSGSAGSGSLVMVNYLDELGTAYPEVRSLQSYWSAVWAARDLHFKATIASALELSDGLNQLAQHFDNRPDATFIPTSLSNTASAKETTDQARQTFSDLPDQVNALAAVFAARPDDIWIPTTLTGGDAQKLQDAIKAFVSSDHGAARLYVTSSSEPYSGAAFSVIKNARGVLGSAAPGFGAGAAAYIGGPTAQFTDVQDTLARDFQMVGIITVLGVLVVLILLLRAIVAPLYLVATVLVSYASTVGIAGFVFQDLLGQAGISPYLPLIVFVLLVALGSDYNIFLMSRVREESEDRPIREGVRIASGRTGAVITSAGIVLAGTFGSMIAAPVGILVQVGFAVAVGVLIDTFLVRSILVPAITSFVADYAWWPAGAPLARLFGRLPGFASPPAEVMAATGTTARPRSRLRLAVSLMLAVFVPVVVASLLTWSFGSSSGNVASIKAAVVNLDQGGSVAGPNGSAEQLTLGADLVRALTAGGNGFTWVTCDQPSAAQRLSDGTYAAVVTIPADFSRTVAAIRSDPTGDAPKATLDVATNDSSGPTLGVVARAITTAIGTSTAQGITATYVDDVLVKVTNARDALAAGASQAASIADDGTDIADDAAGTGVTAGSVTTGLRQLADATSDTGSNTQKLLDGMDQLAAGTDTLAAHTQQLANGASTASDNTGKLADGAAQLATGLRALKSKTESLPSQVQQLATGADGLATGTAGIADGARQLADGLDQMKRQTTGMGAGAVQLDTGAAALESGAHDLRDGADAAAAGASDLANGASKLSTGVDQYTGGVDSLAANCTALGGGPICAQLSEIAAGSAELRTGAQGVDAGASQLNDGVHQLASGMDGIVDGAHGVHQGTSQLAQTLPALESGIAHSAGGADELASGADQAASGAKRLSTGTDKLADGMPQLTDGIGQLSDGASTLSDGIGRYAVGISQLADGSQQLATGARQTADGAKALADGASSAMSGVDQLHGGLQSAADAAALVQSQVQGLADNGGSLADNANALSSALDQSAGGLNSYDDQSRAKVGDLAAQPISVAQTTTTAASAENGLAPWFMAVALWLAVLGAFLVLPALGSRAGRARQSVVLGFLSAAAVAVVGAMLMVGALNIVVGVSIADASALAVLAALAALAFTAVVQALIALFGTRGWFLALLVLVVAIAASGLGMNVAAIPGPLAAIRPLLPLTYAADALGATIAGTTANLTVDAVALTAFLVAGLLATLAAAAIARSGARDSALASEP